MRLLIDLGNSHLKWTLQTADGTEAQTRFVNSASAAHSAGDCPALREAIAGLSLDSVWLASVAGTAADRVCEQIAAITPIPIHRAHSPAQMDGIRNAYAEPGRLGVDRFLALLGARRRYPGCALIVVDAGTALTVDLLEADGQHRGGSIAPGIGLMRHSLGMGTATLGASARPPQVQPTQLGSDTQTAIECGILAAACGAVEMRRQQSSSMGPKLLLTGGDGARIASAFADAVLLPQLVLEGLARYADCAAAAA